MGGLSPIMLCSIGGCRALPAFAFPVLRAERIIEERGCQHGSFRQKAEMIFFQTQLRSAVAKQRMPTKRSKTRRGTAIKEVTLAPIELANGLAAFERARFHQTGSRFPHHLLKQRGGEVNTTSVPSFFAHLSRKVSAHPGFHPGP